MRMSREHNTTKQEAIRKIDRCLDELLKQEPSDKAKLEEFHKSWDGGTMTFSLKVKKGFMSINMKGIIEVMDTSAALTMDLPLIVQQVVGEEKVRKIINEEADTLFT